MKTTIFPLMSILALLSLAFTAAALADDAPEKLAEIFLPNHDWQLVADGLGFSDGLCADADGNVYFSDLKAKALYKITPDGTKTKILDAARSGNKFGPDGKLYSVGSAQAVAYDLAAGTSTVLAEKISTNDLIVSHKGHCYLTETGKKQITFIDPKTKEVRA